METRKLTRFIALGLQFAQRDGKVHHQQRQVDWAASNACSIGQQRAHAGQEQGHQDPGRELDCVVYACALIAVATLGTRDPAKVADKELKCYECTADCMSVQKGSAWSVCQSFVRCCISGGV